ncbi:ABC transporter ATP-binding protein [Ramlibacter sp. PS4R-6]|uniref:ABC transporter ATP-binding protein n=1 Tax=Ramlibacter sp. PS4R-6 TaxID=3133438 RepID=UPI0030A1E442
MNAAIRAQALHASLGGVEVLHGVDVVLPGGKWTSIVGPNGAGKTTLLKALAQLTPSRGAIELLGRDARALPMRERARRIAWLGQNEGGAEDLLARDVVMLGRLPHQEWLGPATAQDHAAAQAAMEQTQCWDWRERPLGQLSGGERQRVLLARALAVRAPVLMMDEPLANLDPPHQADWLRIVREHVQRGGTAVAVLHEITMALHADEMVVMDAGRIVHHGACADTATHRAVERVFGGRVRVREIDGRPVALPDETPAHP